MTSIRAVAVIRHNTNLGGDLKLAIRELESIAKEKGLPVYGRNGLGVALGNPHLASIPEIRPGDDIVALSWPMLDLHAVNALLRCSGFLQELFLVSENRSDLASIERCCLAPYTRAGGLEQSATVAIAWGYIVESEAVLDQVQPTGRIRMTIDLLLEPYSLASTSQQSRRIRKAKKTTLSLSHDLHIYKAKFFPRMVRAMMNIFGQDGAKVVDPFCGSGTALLEASLLGYDSVGIDVDPICQMIARTKVTPFLNSDETLRALEAFDFALGEPIEAESNFLFPEELAKKIERRDRIDGTKYLQEICTDAARLANAMRLLESKGHDVELIKVLASDAVTKKIRYRFVGVGNGRYTIEFVKQTLLDRVREKTARARELCFVFKELRDEYGLKLGQVTVHDGDARVAESWKLHAPADLIITSPPYLPASSGREHYTASRALSFAVLGIEHGKIGYYNVDGSGSHTESDFDLGAFEEARRLMDYLLSDASDAADPQRDAMRFERKAMPTRHYLSDMARFFSAASSLLAPSGHLLLVVANQHTFYSHRRNELEHIVSGSLLYGEIAAQSGWELEEVVTMELLKSSVSKARPRASEDYFEAILVSRHSPRTMQDKVTLQGSSLAVA